MYLVPAAQTLRQRRDERNVSGPVSSQRRANAGQRLLPKHRSSPFVPSYNKYNKFTRPIAISRTSGPHHIIQRSAIRSMLVQIMTVLTLSTDKDPI